MVRVNISEEELEVLKGVIESRELRREHLEAIRRVLMRSGILLNFDEFVAIKNGNTLCMYLSDLFVEIDLSAENGREATATVVIENVVNPRYRERIDITFVAGRGSEGDYR
jgi:hypothetical protein